MKTDRFFDVNSGSGQGSVPKKVFKRKWELAACAFLFGVAMIIIGVFL